MVTGLEVGNYVHKHLGKIKITEECVQLQNLNPDRTSLFVEHKGEVKEVSVQCVL